MPEQIVTEQKIAEAVSFFERPGVQKGVVEVGGGVPYAIERVSNPELGMGGAYGAWGESYDNEALSGFVSMRLGETLQDADKMNLSELGFLARHHTIDLTDAEHLEVEVEVGARLLTEAAAASGWQVSEVDGLLIGMSAPVSEDYVARIAERAGLREDALKVSVHKACDGSMGALHLALNPALSLPGQLNVAESLRGKKVLVGGIEGLSRFTAHARDKNALQLFGNGMGVFGLIPGETMTLLAGKSFETYDEEGLLQVKMYYPHSRGDSLLEVSQVSPRHIRVAGLMHEPADGLPIVMAGLMGMVKLFVRSGVQVVAEVCREYTEKLGKPANEMDFVVVHHANYKINALKAKQLLKEGISIPMPWVMTDFGNVSAASCAIAYLRQIDRIRPGAHVLFDGFGAGTYYDVMAIEMGRA